MTYRLFWNSVDGQSSLHMGDFASEQEALDAVPGAKSEILAQGGAVDDGYWSVDRDDSEMPNATTDAQLRTEAGAAGDTEMVELCDAALEGDASARTRCEKAIRSAQAMQD